HLGSVHLEGSVPDAARAKLDLRSGAPAAAAEVLAARTRLLTALRDQGYALASVDEPVATLRPEQALLDVSFLVKTGPRVDIGPITISGLDQVNESFVRQRLEIHQGEQFSASEIEKARQDLAGLGVFSAVRAVPADTLDPQGQLPIAFDVTERKRRAVTFGAFYSTDLGVGVNAGWSHRNLFGNAEQLNLTAGFQGGGTALTAPGYNANIQFVKPDFLARDQQLQLDLGAVEQSLQAYDQTAVTADILIRRKFLDHWIGSIGLSGEISRITQQGVTRDYTLLGIPITARYDNTDSLFAPTSGIRAIVSVTPTESFRNPPATFVLMQAQGSTYVDLASLGLTDPGRSVFAFRGLIGSAQGASQFDLPPDKRFYAGGSGTVRGYRFQSVGPQFPVNNDPQGGTSIVAGGAELRQRIIGNYGMAVFLDVGQVAANSAPFTGVWRAGAGAGARYYTSIGPIRLDIAFPLIKQTGSDALEVYIGIGEAF
ncbi:MAG: BamA/TamA family outer membrane protein, partial [Alphaproteobacteria bacterium]|nr:BamA/TamA family outer membrane protein [Alphaproteobacteria bacterium]